MITRLEADGFKNLVDFAVDLGPFTCIAGPNGVGKSNIYDAILFLSLLADRGLEDAALRVRGVDPETSDISDLFWTDGVKRVSEFLLAVEMLIEEQVDDDFGRKTEASSTFLRYEVRIGYEPPERRGTLGEVKLLSESLDKINKQEAGSHLRFPHHAKLFRQNVVVNRRFAKSPYISTEIADDGMTEILVHQDGRQGRPQRAPAETAPKTIVGTSNTAATPTVLAARREMQSWRLLALEPSAMRRADRFRYDPHITASGEHLPATLHRLSGQAEDPEDVFARVENRLSELIDIDRIWVDVDEARQLLTIRVVEDTGVELPARSLSDGTLRFLTLCVLAEDPSARGVLCMEEPENGIHPERLEAMRDLLQDLAVDPNAEPGRANPLRQIVVATHSPGFVQLQRPRDLLFATASRCKGPGGRPTSVLRCRPLVNTWRSGEEDLGVGLASIIAYLAEPSGAQLTLKLEEARENSGPEVL